VNILIKSIIVATAIMAAYLTHTLSGLGSSLTLGLAQTARAVKPLEKRLEVQQELITELRAEVAAFRKEVNDRIQKEEQRKSNLKQLKNAIAEVTRSEQLRAGGKPADAAKVLLGTQDAIWKAGDVFQGQQKALRGMMGPIDVLAGKWKGGDGKATAGAIIRDLKKIYSSVRD